MALVKKKDIDPPSGLILAFYRFPILLYRIGLGGLLGRRFLMLHHRGRQSGQWRYAVLEVVRHSEDDGVFVVASGFGERSAWYQNLTHDPRARIESCWKTVDVVAQRMDARAAEAEMVDYGRRNPRAARMVAGLIGYTHDGSDDDLRALSKIVPLVQLKTQ